MSSSHHSRLDLYQFRVSDTELELMKGKVIVESSEIVDLVESLQALSKQLIALWWMSLGSAFPDQA